MRYQQGNLFLVAESLLTVAYSTVLAGGNENLPAARAMAAFGVAITLIWLYTGHRHLTYSRALRHRAAARFRDYAETLIACRPRGWSSLPLIAYALPSLAAVMWTVLLLVG
ncbi:hypothetical protein ABT404_19905 [Streptomyces hyaluromycini]|uniref:Uncharacterized protein n=1 Tax=Streptomyces hyaluromycini TaxID=1377993 RepID=A0ABV1WY83_9ACTN